MKTFFLIAAITVSLGGAVANTAELPSYELLGFPITPHQSSVVGSSNIREYLPGPSLTMAGMPTSPSQVAVLTPRPRLGNEVAITNPVVETSFSIR
jgi:hypothetical protein